MEALMRDLKLISNNKMLSRGLIPDMKMELPDGDN
jgi:hypothetical protein